MQKSPIIYQFLSVTVLLSPDGFYFRVAVCQVTELKPDYVTSTGDVYGSLRDAEQVLTQRNITDIACSDAEKKAVIA